MTSSKIPPWLRPARPGPDWRGYEAEVLPGLEPTSADELRERLGAAVRIGRSARPGRLPLWLRGEGWEALVRLTPRPLAARAWRVCNLPGALDATAAHAMARWSTRAPDERLVNLACGSGTLLVERLALGPAAVALGVDRDEA